MKILEFFLKYTGMWKMVGTGGGVEIFDMVESEPHEIDRSDIRVFHISAASLTW
jgi:hypothetical protein